MNSTNSIVDTDSKQTDFSFTSADYITDPICIVGRIPESPSVSFFDDDRGWYIKLTDKFFSFLRNQCH